jgi:hypothetical protein
MMIGQMQMHKKMQVRAHNTTANCRVVHAGSKAHAVSVEMQSVKRKHFEANISRVCMTTPHFAQTVYTSHQEDFHFNMRPA